LDEEQPEGFKNIYNHVLDVARRMNIQNHVIIHDWIPYERMGAYYTYGDVTLSPGTYMESFELVTVESLAAGTPVVRSKCGAKRTILPNNPFAPSFHFDDIDGMVNQVMKFLTSKSNPEDIRNSVTTSPYLKVRMVQEYERVFVNTAMNTKDSIIQARETNKGTKSKYVLAPWCYLSSRGIYNDYTEKYYTLHSHNFIFNKTSNRYEVADKTPTLVIEELLYNGIIASIDGT
jgi:hypothetical protein